jgi:ABC-type antimicrobial peptide transport system permease subunit
LGLALSLTCVVIIARYVHSEMTVDGFNTKLDRIYIVTQSHLGRTYFSCINNPKDISEVSGIDKYSSFIPFEDELIVVENQQYNVNLLAVDTSFLHILDYTVIRGTNNIRRPEEVFLTETFAAKIFGTEDPLGKTITYPGVGRILTVAGIVRTPTTKTLLSFDMLVPLHLTIHWSRMPLNLILLHPEVDYREINLQTDKFQLFPYKDIYFDKHTVNTFGCFARGNIFYSSILSFIGIILLLAGLVNYINIHSVVMIRRNRELGMKKVFGAGSGKIFMQLHLENLLLIVASLIIAFWLAATLHPFIENTLGIRQYPNLRFDLWFAFVLLAALPVAVSVVPCMRYRYFSPIRSLRSVSVGNKSLFSRKFTLCFQYFVTMGMMTVSLFFAKQLVFMLNKDLGFRTHDIIQVPFLKDPGSTSYEVSEMEREIQTKKQEIIEVLKQKLNESALLEHWSFGYFPINMGTTYRFRTSNDELHNVNVMYLDETRFEMFGVRLLAGRSWNNEIDDRYAYNIIVSESTLKQFDISNYSEGEMQPEQRFWWSSHPDRKEEMKTNPPYRIVGVVKDFYPMHLSRQPDPVAFLFSEADTENPIIASFAPERRQDVIAFMKNLHSELVGGEFTCSFIEDAIKNLYSEDRKVTIICSAFTGIAVLISMLGLLGISLFDIRQRRKEIAIRKINGAQVSDILRLLLRKYFVLLGLAFVVATPMALFAIHKYLENFAYKAPISWWLFAIALFATIAVSLATLIYQTYKAGNENPATVIKDV